MWKFGRVLASLCACACACACVCVCVCVQEVGDVVVEEPQVTGLKEVAERRDRER